ncbi:hypothetical protein [Rhizobium sp. BK609]|uniref:hypothetical protein n=1 Tax=unclassified Rhizobium TaxID=2613769 RepID=UPI001823864F|nr:hypothetical protein [Rhizobium sp. BK098]MBB3617954.1 hypothetical protein [Rhizobium sp. BK609]MBB3683593.1 hypothetical protein [Rhizobium sp. BK612]
MAAAIAFLVGTTGGYAIDEVIRSDRETDLEHEVARLKDEVSQKTNADVPSDEEVSAALAQSGRSMRISECKPRQAVPGVTCSGIITTTAGSFAGASQPVCSPLLKLRAPGGKSNEYLEGADNETGTDVGCNHGRIGIRAIGNARKGRRSVLGMPGSALRRVTESVLARGSLLRSAHDKAHRGDEGAGIFVAYLP